MKKLTLLLASTWLLSPLSQADTFTLTDGTVFEGKILSENATELRISVEISSSIRRNKTIKREDIVSIKGTPAWKKAYVGLDKLTPTPDLLPLKEYELRVAKLVAFQKKFTFTPKHKEIKAALTTLNEERAKVAAGSFKVSGKWFDPATQESNAVDFDAVLKFKEGKALSKKGYYPKTLHVLDQFTDVYANTPSAEAALKLRTAVLKRVGKKMKRLIAAHPKAIEKQKKSFKTLKGAALQKYKADLRARKKTYEDKLRTERTARYRWLSANPFELRSMQRNLDLVLAEIRKKPSAKSETPTNELYRNAWTAIESNNFKEARQIIGKMRKKSSKKYHDKLRIKLKEAQAAFKATEKERIAAERAAEEAAKAAAKEKAAQEKAAKKKDSKKKAK